MPEEKQKSKEKNKTEKLKKNSFVEIEYTGKIKGGKVFDTNVEKEAKKINPDAKVKPFVICVGQNMILPAMDEFLIGKEIGKKYVLDLPAEKAFGIRKRELIKTMPLSVFKDQKFQPQPGMVFNFDNLLGKIISKSGGRVIVDFNNPLAGKDIIYELKLKRKITDKKEKIKALIEKFFGKELKFKLEDKKLIIEAEEKIKQFIEIFKPKFKEILSLNLEIKSQK